MQFVNPPTPPVINLINHGIDELMELKELKPHKEQLPISGIRPDPDAAPNSGDISHLPVPAKLLYDDSLAAFAPSTKPGTGSKKPFDLLETACIEAPLSNLRARAAVRAEYSALKERHRRRKKMNNDIDIVSEVVEVESEDEEEEIVEVWQGGLD